ncbi:prepilin peptidase [Pseudoxanthomonas mexicana]|jgi:leader peptidase (prepilin peptidase)/N-methyltransferase|uniref:Prepilin leader peptidase/N-methyltransferase n=1 Tax=Pseudoxanthomonas mexicana TaxID=128785 RepID=A0A7G9TCJ9_PSEMX|nr:MULTISPECIES: A24 family peptidase [Pseudoxanthomonas]MCP1583148.1 leader peptidase (prepilin peptidase)/N-methyltransferase [Pseudoxanthomonas mexicana]QNN77824.1 prepilin peptidase [Pseudoxanthomonas mexicana]UOV04541.1 A24 family peptidase [Pseudoxanthomonas mexicana]UOV09550.1 A24 family peptidase [Pseudoxanthomonas sp. F37]WBX92204.1 A24 family peptidase [Pseudoxanthomonas mexicana]
MAFLDQHPELGYPVVAGLGLLVGSFLNVVILRLPRRLEWEWKRDAREVLEEPEIYDPPPPGIVVERSHCPHCKTPLSWYENIPLFSWLVLRGKCRHCKAPISPQYPLVELLTALLAMASVWRFGFGWQGFGAALFSCYLVALSGIDLRTRLLPDQLTLPLMWLGLIGSLDNLYMPAKPALLGAIAGYVSLWLVWWLFKQVTGKEGMGRGDFKLLAAIGAWVGLNGVLPTLLLSSVVGAVIGSVWLATQGRDRATPIPFGPYLAIAGWIVFFWGPQIIDAYLRFAGLK